MIIESSREWQARKGIHVSPLLACLQFSIVMQMCSKGLRLKACLQLTTLPVTNTTGVKRIDTKDSLHNFCVFEVNFALICSYRVVEMCT